MSLIQTKTNVSVNPRRLLLFASPKVGKTTAVAGLKNALIIDFEDGTNFVTGDIVNVLKIASTKLKVNPKEVLNHPEGPGTCIDIIKELAAELQKTSYDYIIIDSVTALLKIATFLAGEIYKSKPMGKNYTGRDVVADLPNGGGYDYLRQAYEKLLSIMEASAKVCSIEIGHVKDSSIQKNGTDVSARDISLPGKLKLILCANADAIGYMYRRDGNKTMLSFKTDERDQVTGARPPHLAQKEFVIISEKEPGSREFEYGWDQIFIKE